MSRADLQSGKSHIGQGFTVYQIAFVSLLKLYRKGLLFKNGCGGAISVTERRCAAPISKVESHISDRCSYYPRQLSYRYEKLSGFLVSGTWLSDSNRQRDSGFRLLSQDSKPRITDSTRKNSRILDSKGKSFFESLKQLTGGNVFWL